MKKRMTILALLLAGAVTLGSYGMVQAGQEKREVPVAGVTQTLAQVLKEAQGVQAQTADAVEELQSNAAVARMMEPEMVAEEAWETAEIAENELPQTAIGVCGYCSGAGESLCQRAAGTGYGE